MLVKNILGKHSLYNLNDFLLNFIHYTDINYIAVKIHEIPEFLSKCQTIPKTYQ